MLKPASKLPFTCETQLNEVDDPSVQIFDGNKNLVAELDYAHPEKDGNYIVGACNVYPTAIALLIKAGQLLSELEDADQMSVVDAWIPEAAVVDLKREIDAVVAEAATHIHNGRYHRDFSTEAEAKAFVEGIALHRADSLAAFPPFWCRKGERWVVKIVDARRERDSEPLRPDDPNPDDGG